MQVKKVFTPGWGKVGSHRDELAFSSQRMIDIFNFVDTLVFKICRVTQY